MSGDLKLYRFPLLKSLKDMAKSGAKLDASILTTYAFNGLFYEEVLLRAFERAGSRLNIVLVDAAQLAESMSDPFRRPGRAGSDYLLAPVPHIGAFHPKIVALLSEKQPLLAIGSHNATDAGYSHNEELTAFWGPGRTPPIGGLRSAVDYALDWLKVSGAVPAALVKEMDERLRALLPKAEPAANEDIAFLGSRAGAPLWDQLRTRVVGTARRVWVVGPYFDADLSLLHAIHETFGPEEIIVAIQPDKSVLPRPDLAPAGTRFVDAAAMERFWPEAGEVGFAHGKALAIQTDDGLLVSMGSANPTGAAWLAQPTWNAEANLCFAGEGASAAFRALGFEGLTHSAALPGEVLEQLAARSQEVRRRDQEASAVSSPPVLVAAFAEGGLFVSGLTAPGRDDLILQGAEDADIPARIVPGEAGALIEFGGARPVGGIYRLRSADETFAFILVHDEQALRAASLPRESVRILDHLGALDAASGFTELLDLLDKHVLSASEPGATSGASRAQRSEAEGANGGDADAPFGPRGVSLPSDIDDIRSRRPRLNDGLIADIISALMRALGGAPAQPPKDGDAPDLDEGDVEGGPSSDQIARNIDAETERPEIDWPRLVTACRKRLGLMIARLEQRLAETATGAHTPAWALGRMVVVLSLLQQLRKHPPQISSALSGRVRPTSLVSQDHLKSAFGVTVRALYGDGRIAEKLESAPETRGAEERHLIDNLLLWFAREIGADCAYRPGERLDGPALQRRADLVPVAMSAAAYPTLEPWAEHRDPWLSIWDDSAPVDNDWTVRQIAIGRALQRLRGADTPAGRPARAGELVQWAGELGLPWVLADVAGNKATILGPAGVGEKRVLVSSVTVLDSDSRREWRA